MRTARPAGIPGRPARGSAQVSLRVEAVTRRPLEPRITDPDGGMETIRVARLHQLAEGPQAADRVEVGVLLDVIVVRVPVVDRRPE